MGSAIGRYKGRVVALREHTLFYPFYVSPSKILICWRSGLRCEIDEPPVVGVCDMTAGLRV